MKLETQLQTAAAQAKAHKGPIRIIGHLDADGLCATAILVKALLRLGKRHDSEVVQQLDEHLLSLADQPGNLVIFADLGSGQFSLIRTRIIKAKAIVLDHHQLDEEHEAPNIIHINPRLLGMANQKEASGASLAYLFALAMSKENKDLAHLAIIGALGDQHDQPAFSETNQRILEDAKAGSLAVTYGLRLYCATTRPLHKVLEFSDHAIPGVSGDENGALAFLVSLGIKPKDGARWRTLSELSAEEYQKLIVGIIVRRARLKNPEAILGPVYTLKEGELRDCREFCTLLNACGRLNKSSLAIGACLGDPKSTKKALSQLDDYKRQLVEIMRWFKAHRGSEDVQENEGYLIINAHDSVMPTMIGTLCSILARTHGIEPGTIIIGLARLPGKQTKISIRQSGGSTDLYKLAMHLAEKAGGRAGGHPEAAGAVIPTIMEGEFIDIAIHRIEKMRK